MTMVELEKQLRKILPRRFLLRIGILGGICITILSGSFSFIKPHLDYIVTVLFFPSLFSTLFIAYVLYSKTKLVDKITQELGFNKEDLK